MSTPNASTTDQRGLAIKRTVGVPLGIGLIGAGKLGREVHLPCIGAIADAHVVAVAEPCTASLRRALELAPSARGYEDVGALLADDRVEAVLIGSPTHTHADLAEQAFAACKHVYLEKPMATTLPDARRVLEAWRVSGKIAMIGFNYRHRADYEDARRLVAQGAIGAIKMTDVRFTTRAGQAKGWRDRGSPGGGVLLDLASHEFDLVHWVLDEPIVSIQAMTVPGEGDGESVHVTATTASGIAVRGFFSSETIDDAGMELVGSLGKISIDRYAAVSVARRGPSPVGPFAKCVSAFGQLGNFGRMYARRKETWNEASFREAVSQFVFGVIHQEQPQPDLHAGLASLGVVVAAQQSLATGKPVDVSVDNPLSS